MKLGGLWITGNADAGKRQDIIVGAFNRLSSKLMDNVEIGRKLETKLDYVMHQCC
jgi:hypothetical protein